MSSKKKVLIYASIPSGGIAEHVYYQAKALNRMGYKIICLSTSTFLEGREGPFEFRKVLHDLPPPQRAKMVRRFQQIWGLLANWWTLAWHVMRERPDFVLLDCYAEYFSPLWIWPHWVLSRWLGIPYAANLHDPVRKNRFGGAAWHRLSVWLAYAPIKVVLVHSPVKPEAMLPGHVRVAEVPVGVYDIRPTGGSRAGLKWRARPGQRIFLSFGYIRDSKNLDLSIRALKEVPEAYLVIAGAVNSASEKPVSFYRNLAAECGVEGRCHFEEGFVSDEDLGAMFAATDFVLLTYASSFHSQSGVLNIAARARKPVLASAAPGPLVEAVSRFQLGVVVAPDSVEALAEGMRNLLSSNHAPRWPDYESFASWETNVRRLIEAIHAPADGAAPLAHSAQNMLQVK